MQMVRQPIQLIVHWIQMQCPLLFEDIKVLCLICLANPWLNDYQLHHSELFAFKYSPDIMGVEGCKDKASKR